MMFFQGLRVRSISSRPRLTGFFASLAIGFTAAPLSAAMTTIRTPDTREDSHAAIFSQVYGGTFTAAPGGGGSFTSDTMVATRVDDDIDEVFITTSFDAYAKAVFASYGQSFGYLPGDGEGGPQLASSASREDFVELFDVMDSRYRAKGSAQDVGIDGLFRFARNGSQGVLASSRRADNPSDADHMVTYLLTPMVVETSSLLAVPSVPVFVLFFEDTGGSRSDRDFQDLVVEVRGATPVDLARVPEPATAAVLASAAVVALLRRR